uniref:Uncharacterized protein n=1 Tax=Mucochytrium quahogii TaxID=96639 RepID=A0A7S2S798_9STRA|mmetsp:Transcript_38415/g.62189  ORF Transcript_38415/g.62189 Transcript_38415/m.62189 type:complete len:320 (+) Transcript_38415:264-1223(+)
MEAELGNMIACSNLIFTRTRVWGSYKCIHQRTFGLIHRVAGVHTAGLIFLFEQKLKNKNSNHQKRLQISCSYRLQTVFINQLSEMYTLRHIPLTFEEVPVGYDYAEVMGDDSGYERDLRPMDTCPDSASWEELAKLFADDTGDDLLSFDNDIDMEFGCEVATEQFHEFQQAIDEAPEQPRCPAPVGYPGFEETLHILLHAESGKYSENIQKRFSVSPIHPDGPKHFYIVDRACKDTCNLYNEGDIENTKAVRIRSTKRTYWFPDMPGVGLRFRELTKTERKTGRMLSFGGCLYELVRLDANGHVKSSTRAGQLLQIWKV